MSETTEKVYGVECDLPDGRKITCFPVGDGTFQFTFINGDVETRVRLSSEAVQAMSELWFELVAKGLAA